MRKSQRDSFSVVCWCIVVAGVVVIIQLVRMIYEYLQLSNFN